MQKELARRTAVECPGESERQPKCANWTIPDLIKELKKTPPEPKEQEYIVAAWNSFKADIREHYLSKSHNQEADIYRKLRLVESILSPDIRDAFKQRNRQLCRHEIDARNSTKAAPTYYDQVATIYNSECVLYSSDMGTDYGEPFEVVHELKQQSHSITGAYVKEYLLSLKHPFLWLEQSITASGSGDSDPRGSEVKQFCQHHRRDEKGNVMALGDVVGYAFKRCKQEGVWDSITSTMDNQSAATMENNPQIETPRNLQSNLHPGLKKRCKKPARSSSSRKKRAKSSGESEGYNSDGEGGDQKTNLMNRFIGNFERTGMEFQINDVRQQMNEEEKILVMMEESFGTRRAELRGIERELMKDGMDKQQFGEDRWWVEANEAYESTKQKIADATSRLAEKKAELEALQTQYQMGFDTAPNVESKSPVSSTRQRSNCQ